jgi:hypothetical protein
MLGMDQVAWGQDTVYGCGRASRNKSGMAGTKTGRRAQSALQGQGVGPHPGHPALSVRRSERAARLSKGQRGESAD